MKRFVILFLLLIPFAALQFSAASDKNTEKICRTFFEMTLKGENTATPHKSCNRRQLQYYRDLVWNCWKLANAQTNTLRFPTLDTLTAKVTGKWTIPAELEPNAVMPYYWGYKGRQPKDGLPFFLYIHGSGPKAQEWETGHKLALLFEDAPSLYFIPQIPNEGPWFRWWQKGKQYIWERLLRNLLLREDINPNRLYLFGISEGGYGSQRLASFYADYWAAAGPMAGGEPLKNAPAENLSNTAFSLRTGADDTGFYRNILTKYTQESLDSLHKTDPELFCHHVELIPHRQHHIDYRPTTPWLSKFTRNPWPHKFIWEDFEMDGLHRKGFYNLYIQERAYDSLRTRYDVEIADNKVNVRVQNVEYTTIEKDSVFGIEMKFERKYTEAQQGQFIIFLNEHLVDFNRPVKVKVNGKVIYNDFLKMDLQNMLLSTSLFYDPERIFPASVKVIL